MERDGRTLYNGLVIQALRRKSFLDRKAFAQACGVSPQHITNIENGNKQPSDELAMRMASRLGVNDLRVLIGCPPEGAPIPVVAEPVD